MKTIIPFCLTLIILIGSAGVSNALPNCEGSPRTISDYKEVGSWNNCEGTVSFGNGGGKRAGNNYVGEWKDGKLHGQGTYTFADGNKYVGEWKDGKFHGQGTYTYANGAKHVGEFRDDQPHGQGTYTYADGAKHVGEFRDGKGHGQGTFTHANGNKYVGEYRDDQFHGQGTYTFANGAKHVGEFRDGKPHGQGTYTYADGRKKAGVYENGKLKPGICSKEGDRKDLTLCVTKYWEEDTWCVMNLNLKNRSKEILQAIG
jgi:hypothetical protein